MLIIFNQSGSDFQLDFQNDSFSQGDSAVHTIDVIVDDTAFSNYMYNGYVQFLREGEKEPSPKLIMATNRLQYNGNYYNGYTFKMESDWFTAIAGTLKMTIEIKKYSNGGLQSNKAYGVVNIPVQESVSTEGDVDSGITKEEYTALINAINSKLNVEDEKVYVLDNNYATIYEFATACIDVAKNNTMERIFFGNIVSTSHTGLTTTEKCVAIITKKFRAQAGTFYNALVITSTGDVVVTDGATELESLAKDSRVLHTIGFLKEVVTGEKTFETNDGTAPVHLKSSFPYVVSDTAGKVGMRAYTEDGEYQGEIAGQFAVSKDDTNENGHFANLQARDNSGNLHTLRVSGKGVNYFINSERHQIPLDENVVHKTGSEVIEGSKTFKYPIIANEVKTLENSIRLSTKDSQLQVESGEAYLNGNPLAKKWYAESLFNEAKGYTDSAIAKIIDNAPQTLDTFKEVATYIASDQTFANQITANVNQNRERITALDNTKADRDELFSKNYDELINAPEKLNIVVRDTISADTYNEAREIQIGRDKFKFGSGSKIKANEFVDGTLPTLEYLNIDGKTYKVPNLVTDGVVKLIYDDETYYAVEEGSNYLDVPHNANLQENKIYVLYIRDSMDYEYQIVFLYKEGVKCSFVSFDNTDNIEIIVSADISNRQIWLSWNSEDSTNRFQYKAYSFKIYEIPLGESAQVEKHNKTINALMQRVSDLEQKAGLTSVGYVQDSTLNLIRVNVVDDVLEVSGFKFDGEVMII